jgi:hypothetical protein
MAVGMEGTDDPSSSLPTVIEQARALLRQKEDPDCDSLRQAEELLQQYVSVDTTGEIHALLGLAQFLREKYVVAASTLDIACTKDPGQTSWRDLRTHANRNAITRYDLGKKTQPFDRAVLSAPPALQIREPSGLEPMLEGAGLVRRFGRAISTILGLLTLPLFWIALKFVGRGGPAKTWERLAKHKNRIIKDIHLASIRDYMNRKTQQDPYMGHLVGHQTAGQKRPAWTERYRTATGAWNTDNPMEGAAGMRFIWQGRDPIGMVREDRSTDRQLPNAIAVANLMFKCDGERKLAPFLNLLTIAWIQFMVHDWLNHRHSSTCKDTISVKIPEDDPRREKYGQDYMFLRRTQRPVMSEEPMAFENEVTAWWDGSQIYGSDQATQDGLRVDTDAAAHTGCTPFVPDGKLRLGPDDLLPVDPDTYVIESGFTRNMWIGLELFHTLFVKHHNYLCDQYRKEYPSWSGDQVFQHARLEIAAIMARIHSIEWTPAVLPTPELTLGMASNWHGMVEGLMRPFERRRPLRLIEFANPVLGGVLGGMQKNFGVPQNLSEQFSEVYRLHSGMPDEIEIRPIGEGISERVPADLTRAANSHRTITRHGMATVINSFGYQHMPALVNNNHPAFMTDMSTEANPVLDLAAADIVRARERGVPQFNEFRRQIGMAPLTRFEDLRCSAETVSRLESLYGRGEDGVDKMDLIVGMHCDMDRPLHGFDQTRFAIFLQAASRRLQTDSFYTTKYDAQHYTQCGLDRIDKTTLKSLLLQHYPGLKDSGLMGVNNAFEPWGTTADMRPSEHPLGEAEWYKTKYPGRLV